MRKFLNYILQRSILRACYIKQSTEIARQTCFSTLKKEFISHQFRLSREPYRFNCYRNVGFHVNHLMYNVNKKDLFI